jgi:transposase
MPNRLEAGYQYLDLCLERYPEQPTHQDLATLAKISKSYARKVIIELKNTGSLTDPEATNSKKRRLAKQELVSAYSWAPRPQPNEMVPISNAKFSASHDKRAKKAQRHAWLLA